MTVDIAVFAQLRRQRVPVRAVPPRGVVMGHAEDGTPVFWPLPSREAASHVLVVAASGVGKTVAVARSLVLELLALEAAGEPTALLAIDPKSDLVIAILTGNRCPRSAQGEPGCVLLVNLAKERGRARRLNHAAISSVAVRLCWLRRSGTSCQNC